MTGTKYTLHETNDDDLTSIFTAEIEGESFTFLEFFAIAENNIGFNLALEELKIRKKEVLKKVLLAKNNGQTLLHFAITNKKIEAFQSILEAIKDDKDLLKEVFITQSHHYLHYYRTPLELCIYHYNQCNDYQNKNETDKKITNDVKEVLNDELLNAKNAWDYTKDEDFEIAKEFVEIILNSTRDNGILEDNLVASGIKKDLAKELSDKKYSNDVITDVLQKNQKAEEKGTTIGIVVAAGAVAIATILFLAGAIAFTTWPIVGAIAMVSASAALAGYSTYKFSQPSTKILEINTNQGVGSERQPA